MAQHANLSGNDLHEPKGIAEAPEGGILISDGQGSGAWEPITNYAASSYMALYLFPQEVTRAFTVVNTIRPFTLDYVETITPANMSWDNTTNELTYNDDKTCIIKSNGNVSLSLIGTGNTLLELFFQKQVAGSGVWTTLDCSRAASRFDNNSAHNISWEAFCPVAPGDKLRPVARVDTAESFSLLNLSLSFYSTGICNI